tara:strand:- start:3934 stop:4761 length:828 start_codon:yes stop_codon:yes gene_type:complete
MKKLKDILNEVLSEGPKKMTKVHVKQVQKLLKPNMFKSVQNIIPHKDILFVTYTNYRDRAKIIKQVEKLYKYDNDGRSTNAPRGIMGLGGTNWIAFTTRHNESINEAEQLDTKIFDRGALQDSMKQIRKMVGIEEADEKWPSSKKVRYKEFTFKDGTGGFQFNWEHGVKWGGRLSLSIKSDGSHEIETLSRYDNKSFGQTVKNQNYLRDLKTWRDLTNLNQQTIITKAMMSIKKNEEDARKTFEQDAKDQAAYYGAKADTGRIGYGLSSQPRSRR